MDDHIKRALEQARGLSLTDDITRATQSYDDLIYGPAGSAARQVMDQLNREEEMRKAILGVDSFSEHFLRDFAADQARLNSVHDVLRSTILAPDLTRTLEAITAVTAPLASALAQIDLPKVELSQDIIRSMDALSAVMGPAHELRSMGALALPDLQLASAADLARVMAGFESQFVLPDLDVVSRLAVEVDAARRLMTNSELATLASQMTHPWLSSEDFGRSFGAFADMQAIARASMGTRPFSDEVSDLLRESLGDWRADIVIPDLSDIALRASFYAERGFDPDLTDMPAPAFEQSLELSGIFRPRAVLIEIIGEPVPPADPETESMFARSNRAHLYLIKFEYHFRRYVQARMVQGFGENWPKQKLPAETYKDWIKKRDTAREKGEAPALLIEYADLTDYERFIFARDVWPLFEPKLERKESAAESLRRLYPIRNPAFHARPISQRDEAYLFVELQRLTSLFMP